MISSKTWLAIRVADKALNKIAGWESNSIAGYVDTLVKFGSVEVGYRATCGAADKTEKIYFRWMKIVSVLRKDGLVIIEDKQKHGNAYATNNGGFWNSSIFKLETNLESGDEK